METVCWQVFSISIELLRNMEDDISLDNFDLSKFLEMNTDSDSDSEENFSEMSPTHIVTDIISQVSELQIKKGFSRKATSEMVKLMNGMPETTVKLPIEPKSIWKLTKKKLDYNILLICANCDEINQDNTVCACGQNIEMDSKKNNFIVHFDLVAQIQRILDRNFDTIISYSNRERAADVMTDIDDGNGYKKISEKLKHVNILPFTMNLDGAQIYKSSSKSLWPVQLYLNFLPPNIRFLHENIIVSTVYFGQKKPNITDLLYPLATEFDKFNDHPIALYRNHQFFNFVPVVIQCVCDLPARAEVQCFKGPTGKNACSYCHHAGIAIKNHSKGTTIRYTKTSSSPPMRTHNETLSISQEILANDGKDSIHGIKGQSALFMFDHINIIDSIPTDYMHNVLLGTMKDLVEIWLGKKRIPQTPYPNFKIKTVAARKLLEQRILNLKPHVTFNRKPRSIFEIANFKAIELQNLMFYYLRYTLVGILPSRLVKNFEKLSAAIYILCKKNIPKDEIPLACEMLIEFADEFENIYGAGAVTMNVHILRHYRHIVDNCGPLWSYSMFGFESNIGHLKKYICGTTDVLSQISNKYVISRHFGEKNNVHENCNDGFFQRSTVCVKPEHFAALETEEVSLYGNRMQIWRRARINGQIITSTHAKETKSIDYFVKCKNDRMGKILFFFEHNSTSKLLLHVYETNYQNFHWIEVKPSDLFEVHTTCDIEEKLLYFKAGSIEYITMEPNSYCRSSW